MSGVRFGLWYDFRNPGPDAPAFEDLYEDVLDQIVAAEQMGFASVWLTEHHFVDDGYTPSPLILAAAIGARTRTMRLGTNLIILPLHDPVRIAEDAATLAILTRGRFDLGVAIGYREAEFEAFGRSLKHRPSLMEESVEIIRRAWRGEALNFEGKRFRYGDVRVTPQPAMAPRLFIGGMAEPAIERVARIGDGLLSTGGIGHDVYVEALRRQGRDPSEGRIAAGNWAIIAEDPVAEAEKLGPYILHQTNQYIRWGAFGPPASTPEFADAPTAIENGLYQLWTADEAVRHLSGMLEQYPQIEDVHFWAQFPGEPVESGTRRMEYIAEHVLPRLR
ncbi:MAG: LLM class flavin-dependent oxidoreductase [Gammaproteobacteria bacterium]|nr:LLM class flavin-dependent oxidoreductase [Gammaproteobacteria bacterium]